MAPGKDNENSEGLDPMAWLARHSAQGWIDRSLKELALAQQAFAEHQAPAAAAALKRAAGMALNGALCTVPRPDWGRSYVDHLKAVATDSSLPMEVAQAADAILQFAPKPGTLVLLRSPGHDERLVEAARTVMAHAYAVVNGMAGRVVPPDSSGST